MVSVSKKAFTQYTHAVLRNNNNGIQIVIVTNKKLFLPFSNEHYIHTKS